MNIISKSLHHSNIAFVYARAEFTAPENAQFGSLYEGSQAQGVRFVDDPIIKTKVLAVPQHQLTVTLEDNRLRFDDDSQRVPQESGLISESVRLVKKLDLDRQKLEGFGFNFDCYFVVQHIVPIDHWLTMMFDASLRTTKDLRGMGMQFTLEHKGGQRSETYFLKVTAPLEIALHVNHHFNEVQMLSQAQLQKLFEQSYADIDQVITSLQ